MIVLLVMIQVFYCTNTRKIEYTNIPSCMGKLVFDSPRLQEGKCVYTLVKLYNKANLTTEQLNLVLKLLLPILDNVQTLHTACHIVRNEYKMYHILTRLYSTFAHDAIIERWF